MVAKSTLALVDAKYVEGPCVDDIEYFLGGHAFLRSGQIFVIRDDGSVKLYPPQGLRGDYDVAIDRIASLPGYKKVMARQVRVSLIPAGKRQSYIGLFRGKSDSVIAKFDMLNGNPLAQANILIRSQSPITSVDYLPAPDAPQGRIGFVQPAGTDKAWLYTYDWNHGDLSKL